MHIGCVAPALDLDCNEISMASRWKEFPDCYVWVSSELDQNGSPGSIADLDLLGRGANEGSLEVHADQVKHFLGGMSPKSVEFATAELWTKRQEGKVAQRINIEPTHTLNYPVET